MAGLRCRHLARRRPRGERGEGEGEGGAPPPPPPPPPTNTHLLRCRYQPQQRWPGHPASRRSRPPTLPHYSAPASSGLTLAVASHPRSATQVVGPRPRPPHLSAEGVATRGERSSEFVPGCPGSRLGRGDGVGGGGRGTSKGGANADQHDRAHVLAAHVLTHSLGHLVTHTRHSSLPHSLTVCRYVPLHRRAFRYSFNDDVGCLAPRRTCGTACGRLSTRSSERTRSTSRYRACVCVCTLPPIFSGVRPR